jgi:hypothetical protein
MSFLLIHSPVSFLLIHSLFDSCSFILFCHSLLIHFPVSFLLIHFPVLFLLIHSPVSFLLIHSPVSFLLIHSPVSLLLTFLYHHVEVEEGDQQHGVPQHAEAGQQAEQQPADQHNKKIILAASRSN